MQAYSDALGLGAAGDPAAGRALLLEGLAELRQGSDHLPGCLLDLWEIGLNRYTEQFGAEGQAL